MISSLLNFIYPKLDILFRSIDRTHVKRTRNIKMIPGYTDRRGGKISYAEWAHVIGIFQTVIYQELQKKNGNHFLDIGCGTGLLGISSRPYTLLGGSYTGIDVNAKDINFCANHYKFKNYKFIHLDVTNKVYAPGQSLQLKAWPIKNNSKHIVTALSVWTHLNEEHAVFYSKETYRVLKPGGKAIVTFFYLEEFYHDSLHNRKDMIGLYHSTNQMNWIFDKRAYNSEHWYCPKRVNKPEQAIGVTTEGINLLLKESHLKLTNHYIGNWKEYPGIFFQDILVFEK